jgi:hypothetical protein
MGRNEIFITHETSLLTLVFYLIFSVLKGAVSFLSHYLTLKII